VFWPNVMYEALGVAILLTVLSLNWARGRREQLN
jgi:hypothetical protein